VAMKVCFFCGDITNREEK